MVYIDPAFALAFFNLANLYHYLKDYVQAKRSYSAAIKLLQARPADELIPFTENLSANLLLASSLRGLESCQEKK